MTKIKKITTVLCVSLIVVPLMQAIPTKAADDVSSLKNQADGLNQDLAAKQDRVKEIQGLLNTYQAKIKQQEGQEVTLSNEILLLDNRIREKELVIEEAKAQIDVLNLEIQALDTSIKQQETHISMQKDMLADLVRNLRQSDDVDTLRIFLSRPSLSSYFDRVEEIKQLDGDLGQALQQLKDQKVQLQADQKSREEKRTELEAKKKQMQDEHDRLEMERNSKVSLLAETQGSQEEFNRVLDELRQQKEATADEIANLEKTLKDKLATIDQALAQGQTLLMWPVPLRKITTKFHDPTYPFRYLFEHPGVDLRADVGTPIHAAAGGYVAFTKQGKMYGNYIMLIHPGNLATIYGHLSRFNVKPGTYVERGEIIGFTGGMPGMEGAGLSTGPHLHFEVRQDGIPVDPMGYLPEAVETDTLNQ